MRSRCLMLSAVSTLPLLVAGTPALADPQQAAPAAPAAGRGTDAAADIAEILVTARRRAERLQDVPVAVTSFTSEGLRQLGIQDVTDLERVTPSLKFNQQMGGSTSQVVALRGQSQADILLTTDSSVGVYVDEVNVPRTINLRSAMFDVARVEVLRGPQGTLYGRNTTGGAISIISKPADFNGVHGYVDGAYGNYNDVQIAGALNLPVVDDKLAVRLAGQYLRHDGYAKDRFTGLETSNADSKFFRANVLFRPVDGIEATWTTDWNHAEDNGYAARLRTIGAAPFSSPTHITTGLINYSVARGFLRAADIPSAANGNTAGATFVSGLNAGYADLLSLVDGNGIGFRQTAFGNVYPSGATRPGNRITSWGTGLRLDFDLGGPTLKSITGYRRIRRNSDVDLDATPVTILSSSQSTRARFFSQELQLTGTTPSFDSASGSAGVSLPMMEW